MAFNRTGEARAAEQGNTSLANTATQNAQAQTEAGTNALNTGGGYVSTGANFFNTVANGNRAATSAALAPDINRIRDTNQQNIQAASTLMPRGGGRSAFLFSRPSSVTDATNSMYNGLRSGAATNLAGIGQGQQNLGANLFGIANNSINSAGTLQTANLSYEQQRQKQINEAITGYANAGTRFLFG